tara:strand:- start:114 stop:434 length:321 start_codon:yes stop_codon:yes gene_type:complete
VNLPELTKAEQMLLWGQGQVNLDHPKATVVLTIAEALKSSGYDWATILNIFKVVQERGELPSHFSIVNNKFLVFPSGSSQAIYNLQDCEYVKEPGESKLMALTFWM